jgi:hypothetical protein
MNSEGPKDSNEVLEITLILTRSFYTSYFMVYAFDVISD